MRAALLDTEGRRRESKRERGEPPLSRAVWERVREGGGKPLPLLRSLFVKGRGERGGNPLSLALSVKGEGEKRGGASSHAPVFVFVAVSGKRERRERACQEYAAGRDLSDRGIPQVETWYRVTFRRMVAT